MPKFILIDHSLRDTAGHYYEYAVNVLQAAERAGYDVVLATNRDFAKGDHPVPDWQVLPVYRFDFWGISGQQRSGFRAYRGLRQRAYRLFTRAWVHLRYSWLGYMASMWRSPGDAIQARAPGLGWLVPVALAAYVIAILRALWRILRALVAPAPSTYLGAVLRSFWGLVATLIGPVVVAFRSRNQASAMFSAARRIHAFAADTAAVLRRCAPGAEDIVFIPTLSDIDLVGLERCLAAYPAAGPTWHLLFRRNLYTGREPDYPSQDAGLRPLRNRFVSFCARLPHHRVYFYTDTDKLSDQWNRMHVVPFETLPIPVDQGLRAGRTRSVEPATAQVSYVGDARSEKGYQHLPALLRSLERQPLGRTRLRFAIQSNFTFQRPERQAQVVVARAALQALGPDVARVIARALDNDGYRELIVGSDIGLLLYDRDQYYARSSGALVEYLTAGVPVIVPAGSWLSQQIAGPTYRYRSIQHHEWPRLAAALGDSTHWRSTAGRDVVPMVDAELTFGGESARAFRWVEIPEGATHLAVGFSFTEATRLAHPGSFVRVHVEWVDEEEQPLGRSVDLLGDSTVAAPMALLAVRHPARRAWIGMRNEFGEFPLTIGEIHVDFLAATADLPTGAVGVSYIGMPDTCARLAELIRHLEHYRRTARDFARHWSEMHNPDRLVMQLVERAGSTVEGLAVSAG